MKYSILIILLYLFITVKAQAEDILQTYYNNKLYPYNCSPKCKEEYEKYQPCFNILDNAHLNDTYSQLCEIYKTNECKNFINDIYKIDGVCTNGPGKDDYDVHDEISMNRLVYLAMCSRDKENNLCSYSKNIQDDVYKPVNLFHMKDDVYKSISSVCSKGICRENLKQILEVLIPLYENDVKTDINNDYEKEYIENDKKGIAFLQSKECYSQDPYTLNEDKNDITNNANNLNVNSFLSLLFISIITFMLI